MITLHGMGSPNVLKVLLMLEETGLAYRLQRWDVILGAQRTPAFLEMNPNGKAPVLEDDAGPDGPATIFESGAILIYLAEKTGQFIGPGPEARRSAIQWLMLQMSGIGPTFGQAIHFAARPADDAYAARRFQVEARRLIAVLEQRLANSRHLAGDAYSIADMAVFPWMNTYRRFFPAEPVGPAVEAWAASIAARPAAARMAQLADALSAQDRKSFKVATPEQLDRYFGRA